MIDRRFLVAGLGSASLAASPVFAQTLALKGDWTGVLSVGSASLRLKLVIGDGTAVLYSLDQGSAPIPATVGSLTPELIALTFPAIQGGYRGKLVGDRIEGEFTQGAVLPLNFSRGERRLAAAAARPAVLTEAELGRIRRAASAPAMTAAAQARGGQLNLWCDGERALGSGVPVTRGDRWHLGSITKSMTATLVGRLVDAGKVRWDDTVGAVLGAAAPDMRAEYRAVTYRHLLSHRSGLPANLEVAGLSSFTRELADPRAERIRFTGLALAAAPVGPAERTFTYSNNGYVTAAVMLEQTLGQSWETLIRTHLFAPLKLTTAGIGAPGRAGVLAEPVGHAPGPDASVRPYPVGEPVTDNPAVFGPTGRVHMSMADLTTYLAAHRDRSALLKPATWAMLHTPPFGGDYAMGWMVRQGGKLWHNGTNTLWYAEVLVDAAGGKVAAAAANDGRPSAMAPVGQVLAGALAAV